MRVEEGLRVEMADGAVLLADRYYTRDDGPVVLLRGPYGRRQDRRVARTFARHGYQVVLQSCRGTFGSTGTFRPFFDERADGEQTIAWIARQPWGSGPLLTYGQSYLGITQWALGGVDGVSAAAIGVAPSDPHTGMVFPGGALAVEGVLGWLGILSVQELPLLPRIRALLGIIKRAGVVPGRVPVREADAAVFGHTSSHLQDWLDHAEDDAWWAPVAFGRRTSEMPPTTLVGGWHDPFVTAMVADFQALQAAEVPVSLTIGPWGHGAKAGTHRTVEEALELYDAVLNHQPPGSGVRYFVQGRDEWRTHPSWPPPADEVTLHLAPGGVLGPDVAQGVDTYTYDPAAPTPAVGGRTLSPRQLGPRVQTKREARPDVLTYTGAPLTTALTIAGDVRVALGFESDLDHTDVVVHLCDVDEEGVSRNVTDGFLRLTSPGPVALRLAPTAYTFVPGHRLRLQISSSLHPRLLRNPGTGNDAITRVAHQRVHLAASSVTLPKARP